MNVWKPVELALSYGARVAWPAFQAVNRQLASTPFHPKWAPAPLMKSSERSRPEFGWPRTTDSLCPTCVKETRARILSGEQSIESLVNEHTGEIKAQIVERDGKVVIEKTCPTHGTFVDTLAVNPAFLRRLENLFPGRDFDAITDRLHNHGTSSIKHGRGAVLTIDLTNRCNMMCDPCFMDANQVGYVHELTLDEVKQLLDDAVSIKPRRQMTVQFSGGEPTISPIFLDAVRYAREVGYFSIQAATNGIRFAQDPEFARQARDAGMRIAYLQFDGVGDAANAHRKVGNLFDVKLRAIENLHEAGIDVCLVVTIVNSVNNDQVGTIIKFALENCDKVSFVSFQPVSFTGRDEDISDADRHARRYTLSHLAEDVKRQTGVTDPLRDWFPLSASSALSDVTDLLKGPGADWGTLKCGCHPDCGIGTAFMVSKRTREWAPLASFINVERFLADARVDCRQRPRIVPDQAADRAEPAPELLAGRRAARVPPRRPAPQVRQAERRAAGRPARGAGQRRSEAGRVAADVRRRHVVPGSLDLRLPPHRDVHHPLRHADGGDFVLRLQHRGRLAADRREHVSERHRGRVEPGARQASGLREPAQAGPAPGGPAGDAQDPARRPAGRMAAGRD